MSNLLDRLLGRPNGREHKQAEQAEQIAQITRESEEVLRHAKTALGLPAALLELRRIERREAHRGRPS